MRYVWPYRIEAYRILRAFTLFAGHMLAASEAVQRSLDPSQRCNPKSASRSSESLARRRLCASIPFLVLAVRFPTLPSYGSACGSAPHAPS